MRAVVVVAGLVLASPAAAAPPQWAPADTAKIRPGVQLVSETGQCTSNFVFYDPTDVYLGVAAHCVGESGSAGYDEPCDYESLPVGAPIEVEGSGNPASLAYSSWAAMDGREDASSAACNENDFALVRLHPDDRAVVNPTVPFWNGPTGLRRAAVESGEKLLSYGNSGLRAGIEALKPREGWSEGTSAEGWAHNAYYVTEGIWGDSGSGVMDAAGAATGILVTIEFVPPASNGATDLAHALDYMESHGGPQVTLALGTEPFKGPQYGPGLTEPPASQPDPEPAPPPPSQDQQQQQQPATPPPPPPPEPQGRSRSDSSADSKKKSRGTRGKRVRCRTRGANRRSVRGRRAPKCSKRRSQRTRRAKGRSSVRGE